MWGSGSAQQLALAPLASATWRSSEAFDWCNSTDLMRAHFRDGITDRVEMYMSAKSMGAITKRSFGQGSGTRARVLLATALRVRCGARCGWRGRPGTCWGIRPADAANPLTPGRRGVGQALGPGSCWNTATPRVPPTPHGAGGEVRMEALGPPVGTQANTFQCSDPQALRQSARTDEDNHCEPV